MIHKVFTVYDAKAEAYLPPFFMKTKGEAIRAFTELANDPKHTFGKYPADYTLFEIGEYDDSSADMMSLKTLISMGLALEYQKSSNPTLNPPSLQK